MYSNMIVSYAALQEHDSVEVYFAHYNTTADSSWYLKAGAVNTQNLIAGESVAKRKDSMMLYFIYVLLLIAVSVATWFVARKKYSREETEL